MSSSPENCLRPAKRRRTSGFVSPITPLSPANESVQDGDGSDNSNSSSALLDRAINVLRVEAEALANVAALYRTDEKARDGLSAAVDAIVDAQRQDGKLIVCGVGKSAYIGMKLVATSKSLGISASFMHACEAAHGDLGDIRARDVLLFVSFSGKTPELLNLLPHIPQATQLMAMSSSHDVEECYVLDNRRGSILLPAPIPHSEESTFGVKAPTTSTTVALAISDMLALAVADELHRERTKEVFLKNHPGGAIGIDHRAVEQIRKAGDDISVIELPSPSISDESDD